MRLVLRLAFVLVLAACAPPRGGRPTAEPAPHTLLAGIEVDAHRDPAIDRAYRRADWRHWSDADGDCQNTRQEVLIRAGTELTFTSPQACTVKSGRWRDPYTGRTFTLPSDLDVDHVVPLKDAFVSGGYRWDDRRREAFANDLEDERHLLAVEDNVNQAKRDQSPDEWMPPDPGYHCAYVAAWVSIKKRWGLTMTRPEYAMVRETLAACAAR